MHTDTIQTPAADTAPDFLECVTAFLRSIGIPVHHRSLEKNTFLPGILIDKGALFIDREQLLYPGDILHEAGHLAVVPEAERAVMVAGEIGARENHAAEEMMAIAWSYAACKHLQLDPYQVFHEAGYHGSGRSIADNFEAGRYFGVPMLQWIGMTAEPHQAATLGRPSYPAMTTWLRD